MLEIIIFLVAVCVILGILKAIWDALKDVVLGILGIAILIAAIVFLGPVILSALPVLLPVLAALFVLGCIISFVEKLKYGSQLRELHKIGMKKVSGSMDVWEKPEQLGLVEITASGYVISSRFRKRVAEKVDHAKIVTIDTFHKCCLQAASSFQIDDTAPLLHHMKDQGILVPLQEDGWEKRYLSQQTTRECERLFELEGAATESEFSAICEAVPICSEFSVRPETLARAILSHAVSQGAAHKVELPDLDGELFVSNRDNENSKLVRREISLD